MVNPKIPSNEDIEFIKSALIYNHLTGVFTWLSDMYANKCKGKNAGSISYGYVSIKIRGRSYLAHRLAFVFYYGYYPVEDIDHINGIKNDNRIINLREASRFVNSQNILKPRIDNKTGYLGVTELRGKYVASIQVNYKNIKLGVFDTPQEASEEYLKNKRILHEGCTI